MSRGKHPIYCIVAVIVLLACVLLGTMPASAAVTERVSVSASGEEGNDASMDSSVSADGRFVAFASAASNLVSDDTNAAADVFVRDRLTNSIQRVSVSFEGAQADSDSGSPVISPDGRYVAFHSWATNLVPGDTNGYVDVFLHDRNTGVTERVSVLSTGEQGNDSSDIPTISADGRYVGFESFSTNFAPDDTNGACDVFVRDMTTGSMRRISTSLTGQAGNGWSNGARISDDGSCIAFASAASDLLIDDFNDSWDVFVCDLYGGDIECVSVSSAGREGNSTSQAGRVSADGRYVAFQSLASNLNGGDTNLGMDIFVHDRLTGTTECVSVSSSGAQGDSSSYEPSISADGRCVAFKSEATNLVAGDTNGNQDVFVRDRLTGITERISVSTAGVQANGDCNGAAISGDGRCVSYWSDASNLVPGDTNAAYDTFFRDRFSSGYTHPENVSISPSGGTLGVSAATLASAYRDANGYTDIKKCYLLINDTLTQSSAALFYYDRAANKLYLKNDANTSWGTGYAPGTNVALQNSQCYLYVKDTVVSGSGNNLVVKWRIALKTPFSSKLLKGYMYVQDYSGQTDGWEQMGIYYNVKPEVVGITPSRGQFHIAKSARSVTFASYYRDQNGYQDLRKCYLLLNDALVQTNAVFLFYDRVSNKVYLRDDANTSWGTGYAPGTSVFLDNSQCRVEVGRITVNGSGANLAVIWSVHLNPVWLGSKNLYSWMYATDSKAEVTGYKKVGTHFDPIAPECLELSPNSGTVDTGVETPFMALYEDTNGWADIYKVYIQLSVTSSQANAILLMYDAKLNKVFLRNDAGTSWGSGGVPGSATILENSQCKVNLASFGPPPWSVTDTQLQVSWPIELKPSQIGKKLCERLFVQDNALLSSGWNVRGYVKAN